MWLSSLFVMYYILYLKLELETVRIDVFLNLSESGKNLPPPLVLSVVKKGLGLEGLMA